MDTPVFAAVLLAAAMHAGWNALAKRALDPRLGVTLIVALSGAVAAPFLPFLGLPAAPSLPFLAASVALHLGYTLLLAEAYRTGGLGLVYPVARGTAPAAVALLAAVLLGEVLSAVAALGILLVVAGVVATGLRRPSEILQADRRAVGFALGTAAFIAAYTITDGAGVRRSGNPHGYATLLFAVDGAVTAAYVLWRSGTAAFRAPPRVLAPAVLGAAMALAGYWIVIWAMASAPVALVAALRETSVLFAAILAVTLLGEAVSPLRLAAAGVIVGGALLIRLG